MALAPPTLTLLYRDHRLAVSAATEAGLSLAAAAFAATPLPDLQRRGVVSAVLEVCEAGGEDRYEVALRLVGAGQGTVELAFVDLTPDLRRRLRALAAQAEHADDVRALPLAFSRAAEAPASGGRRLVLPGSAAVWAVTSARRDAFRKGEPHRAAPLPPPPAASRPVGGTAAAPAEPHRQPAAASAPKAVVALLLVLLAVAAALALIGG